ncbi:MAG: hypothetical protein AAFU79_15940 [Myxococcota bacterium]
MVSALSLLWAAALAHPGLGFDPAIDGEREPPSSLGFTVGVDRLDDTIGVTVEVRSPRFLDDRLVIAVTGGIGWFPETVRSMDREVSITPWSVFGVARLRAEVGAPLAESPHRIYAALGPSVIIPSRSLTESDAGIGVHGGLGVELFGGDRFRRWPLALVLEIGATAHLLRADRGVGEAEIARTLATGLALSAGVRFYPF